VVGKKTGMMQVWEAGPGVMEVGDEEGEEKAGEDRKVGNRFGHPQDGRCLPGQDP